MPFDGLEEGPQDKYQYKLATDFSVSTFADIMVHPFKPTVLQFVHKLF